ncbi:MAG: helix-turn-helix domain-containing protein [Albidovulum sp.]|nr:helix-turn-helix domain-containing protein [Albidovulum sp.]MDE0532147.1 helix-turn-helix domain-containing protein [Albidovulum sp.]
MIDEQYLEYVDAHLVPDGIEFMVESHVPKKFRAAYHHHASVEVNYLYGCELEYSFSGTKVCLPRNRMTVFWGAMPHGVTNVRGDGMIVNIYISLSQLLKWGLPKSLSETIISGAAVSAKELNPTDFTIFTKWAKEYSGTSVAWRRLLLGEIEMRLRRLALEGYHVILPAADSARIDAGGRTSMHYIDRMLRFIADNYTSPITVADVASHVGLSPSYAMLLFRRTVGVPIKRHITRIRLSHAQMLLANTDLKILSIAMDSGFNSLSSFYEAFYSLADKTPAAFRVEARQ